MFVFSVRVREGIHRSAIAMACLCLETRKSLRRFTTPKIVFGFCPAQGDFSSSETKQVKRKAPRKELFLRKEQKN
jgi:hypothetical protein